MKQEPTLLNSVLEQRDRARTGHSHAVQVIREKDREITRLKDKGAMAIRQNKRLADENAALAARLRELSPADELLTKLLFSGTRPCQENRG